METNEDLIKKDYEISFLLKKEEDAEGIAEHLRRYEFEVSFQNPIKKITLAYKIKKEDQAYFGFIYFKGGPENIKPFEGELKNDPMILRYMIVTPPVLKSKSESPVTRPKRTFEKVVKSETEVKPSTSLSNEDLEKKIEEILK